MKKILCAILCVCMVFSLCACAELDTIKNTEIPPLPTPEATPEPGAAPVEETEPEATPVPAADLSEPVRRVYGAELGDRVIVYTNKTQEHFDIPDGGPIILIYSYETPTVMIEDRPETTEKINEQLRLLDEVYISGSGSDGGRAQLLEEATDNYGYVMDTGADLNTTFSSARTVKVLRADGSVISFRYWTSVYTGGTKDKRAYFGCTFDSETGEKLTLDSLSGEPEKLRSFLAEQIVSLARADEDLMTQLSRGEGDYLVTLSALVRDGSWYFSGDGMVFFPGYGELSPEDASIGIPLFTIPYASLEGYIDARYLPAQRDGSATLDIVRLDEVEDGTLRSVGRLEISEGEELYLTVQGMAYDVSISKAAYYDQGEGDHFYERERLWYASYMDDCALQLNVLVPAGMPDLMISYTDADYAEHRLLLSESGAEGEPVLVDDTIQAVG